MRGGVAGCVACAIVALSCAREGETVPPLPSRVSERMADRRDGARCEGEIADLLATRAPEAAHRWVERTTLARVMAERATRRARDEGAPTADELERVADHVWPRFNTGGFVSVVHALFPRGDKARARAESLAASLEMGIDASTFERLAHAAGSDVVVERITHIGDRGRTLEGQVLERSFADAANALTMTARRQAVVETSYGYHVILATERVEPRPIDAAERRVGLENEALSERARAELATAWKHRRIVLAPDTKQTLENLVLAP